MSYWLIIIYWYKLIDKLSILSIISHDFHEYIWTEFYKKKKSVPQLWAKGSSKVSGLRKIFSGI